MTDNEICKTVANYIREHGWCQGELFAADGKVCLIGAVDKCFGEYDYHSTYQAIQRKLGVSGFLTVWNDTPGRTVDEVLALLESD